MSIKLDNLEPKRRDVILNAALKEFALKGFDNASTNVIAKEAGMSKPLMFHYVNNKQELFLFVFDYFTELLDNEYLSKLNSSENDIFDRLHQSYMLQIDLIKRYPWILEFSKLSIKTKSGEINKELEKRAVKKKLSCDAQIFEEMDTSKFRKGLDIDTCKQFIYWSNEGFTNQILEEIRKSEASDLDCDHIHLTLDKYLSELKKIFYA